MGTRTKSAIGITIAVGFVLAGLMLLYAGLFTNIPIEKLQLMLAGYGTMVGAAGALFYFMRIFGVK